MKQEYFPNFDWIRLLLAIQVVFIHAGVAERVLISPVPAFLAVSGFVVYGSIQRWSYSRFFLNRALRVLPLLFVSFAAIGILFGYDAMIKNVIFWLWPFGDFPINPVVWSLLYEEFYYILLAILVAAGLYRFWFFPVIACIVCFTMVATNTWLGLPSPLFILGGAFFLGNSFYIFRDLIKKVPPVVVTVILAIAMLVVSLGVYNAIPRPSYAYVDLFSFAAMLAFCIAGPRLPRLKIDISYSLYLIHCIVLVKLLDYIPHGIGMFFGMLVFSVPICITCWYLIEKPALRLKTWKPSLRTASVV